MNLSLNSPILGLSFRQILIATPKLQNVTKICSSVTVEEIKPVKCSNSCTLKMQVLLEMLQMPLGNREMKTGLKRVS